MAVKETLRVLRQARNWPLRELAARAGCDINTVSRIERGRTTPDTYLAERYAQALGITHERFNELLADAKREAADPTPAPTDHTALDARPTTPEGAAV